MNKTKLLFFFVVYNLYPQVDFSEGQTLIDFTHYSYVVSALLATDLNNDGYKELIIGSEIDRQIIFYQNIDGNIQYNQRILLTQVPKANYFSDFDIYAADLNNDGLIDIIITNDYEDKMSWFKNLGDYNFGPEIIISNGIDGPKSLVSKDIDNDGDNDIVVGLDKDENISLFINNGNGTFESQQIIFNVPRGVNKVKLFDLDKNGFLDIISGLEDGTIYWVKNIDGINFSTSQYIAGNADDGFGFDFLDINNDSYYDIVFSSNYDDNLKFLLNENGNSFSSETIIDNALSDPYNLLVKDFDKDGLQDIIVSTTLNDKIGWYRNTGSSSFSSLKLITNNLSNPKYFLIEDMDNNGSFEIIASSDERNDPPNQKLSIFTNDSLSDSYIETIINHFFSSLKTVRIADLNNDGHNDIISLFRSIVWNKNYGNNTFSSQYLISNNLVDSTTDIEIMDMNDDGWLDIVTLTDHKLMIYKNVDGDKFQLTYTSPFEIISEELEVSDLNNDGNYDVIFGHQEGNTLISKLIHNGNFDFQNVSPIMYSSENGYKAYKFKCGDLDNDGDNDILVGANKDSKILWLENNGSGIFNEHLIATSIYSNSVEIGDIDNDGDIDIVTSGNRSSSKLDLNWFRNSGGKFSAPIKIDAQSLNSISLEDINSDGYLDIIGTSYQSYRPNDERIFYYAYNGTNFEDQVTIESLGKNINYTKDTALGDLNNDGKLDIVSSYTVDNTIKYFINSSALSVEDIDLGENKYFKIYPNPSAEIINWDANLDIDRIYIFNITGKIVYYRDNISANELNLSFLSNGIYIFIANSEKIRYTSKFIID